METNSDGWVALRHYNSNPCTIQVRDNVYSFVPKTNVCLAWIRPEDVDTVLSIQANICCGNKAQKFILANAMDVCLWSTGERCE